MTGFETKAELIEAYAEKLALDNLAIYGSGHETDMGVLRRVAQQHAKYIPFISNLGWFIRGFGFSLDRVDHLNRIAEQTGTTVHRIFNILEMA